MSFTTRGSLSRGSLLQEGGRQFLHTPKEWETRVAKLASCHPLERRSCQVKENESRSEGILNILEYSYNL